MQCECFYRILNTKKEAKQLSFGSIFQFSLEDQDETNAAFGCEMFCSPNSIMIISRGIPRRLR